MNGSQRGRVQNVVNSIDNEERLEKILERIVDKIDTIEASDIDEERKDKILGILETIQEMIVTKLV